MNLYQTILLAFLIIAATASWKNTTDFWMKQLGVQSLSYECISGKQYFIKAMRKSTGITTRAPLECITAYSEPMATASKYKIQEYL